MRMIGWTLLAVCIAAAQDRLPGGAAESALNLPAQPVGPNDLLSVSVYGAPELSRTVRVSTEGDFRMPMVRGKIEARGLLPAELERRIAKALIEERILVDPAVTVTIAEYNSRPISVAGAVRHPVTFQATGRTTLLEALTRADGLSPDAGGEILVTRSGGVTQRIPVKDLVEKADPEVNVILAGGEEVRVPEVGRVFVVGNVKKPGAFPMGSAAGMTVLKALALAEGLTPFSTKEAYIYRPTSDMKGDAKTEVAVALRKIMDRKSSDVALEAGDILYIPDNRSSRVTANVIEKAVSFAAGTASGALILGVNR
jgi:polysaccharide export outer membrane protein